MSGIGIIIPGSGPGVGPTIPLPLPAVGGLSWTHRYQAETIPGDQGDPVTTWTDLGSSAAPLSPWLYGEGTITISTDEEDFSFVHFDGGKPLVDGLTPDPDAATIAFVGRVPGGRDNLFTAYGTRMDHAGDGSFRMGPAGTGAAGDLAGLSGTGDWHIFVLSITSTAQTLRIDGAEVAGTFTPGVCETRVGAGGFGSGVMDLAAWFSLEGTAADQPKRAQVETDLRALYGL